MDYQLEIKQIVDYPRCRIYRRFIQTLIEDKGIRTNGGSYLFYYMALYSFVNFLSSYRKLEGTSYLVAPGEWVCKVSELSSWFRTRFQHQALAIMDYLQKQNYIFYSKLGHNLIKYEIVNWSKYNKALDYNYPCLKDSGFFFFPIAIVHEMIGIGKCSEMDIALDLWVHAIYKDEQVQGSDVGPVVYFRNCTGNPLTNYNDLSQRWGISKATVSRILSKLQYMQYLSLVSFTEKHGSVIYLCSYLSIMFCISDVMIDKEEVSMAFQIPISLTDGTPVPEDSIVKDEQIYVSDDIVCVSESHIRLIVKKVVGVLAAQGVSCCECRITHYKLYSLSDCGKEIMGFTLEIACPRWPSAYRFELTLTPVSNGKRLADTEAGSKKQ